MYKYSIICKQIYIQYIREHRELSKSIAKTCVDGEKNKNIEKLQEKSSFHKQSTRQNPDEGIRQESY